MKISFRGLHATLAAALCVAATCPAVRAAEEKSPFARWEPAIRRFEKQDEQSPPAEGGILFVGSSSIKRWDLDESFPNLPVINRGFGGSQIADSVHFADRIILKHKPRVVVLYAGDNDIARGKSPQQVSADYAAFVRKIREKLPSARIVFIAIKPSLSRWKLVEKMRAANKMIRKQTQSDKLQVYVDIDEPMLGDDGRPRKELFVKDGLHLSEQGYRLWAKLVRPHLK